MGSTLSTISNTMPTAQALQWLLSESTKILTTASSIISITSASLTSHVGNLNERAEYQISIVFTDIEEFLSEIKIHGEHAIQCLADKKPEIDRIHNELISSLMECYESHGLIRAQLQEQRNELMNEAMLLKSDVEALITTCSGEDESRYECIARNFSQLSKRSKALVKKFEAQTKKEFEERQKHILQIMSCDRKITRRAYGAVDQIIKDIKQCVLHAQSNSVIDDDAE